MMKKQRFDRRLFIKSVALGAGAVGISRAAHPVHAAATAPSSNSIKYWMHGFDGGEDPLELATKLREAGFNTVVAGGAAVIDAVNKAGMDSWICGGGFSLIRDEDSLKAKDIFDDPQAWFGSASPCSQEIRDASLDTYTKMVKTEGIKGILVDGVRFASPASGLMPFLTDFSDHAAKRAAELDCDFSLMKRDVTRLHAQLTASGKIRLRWFEQIATPSGLLEWLSGSPGIMEWLRFRRIHTTGHLNAIAEIIHGAGLQMGIYIFTPSIAPLVGQSYEDLRDTVDVFAPMIYRNYPDHPGPACLNWELAELPEELKITGSPEEEAVVKAILSWAGFSDFSITPTVEAIRSELPPEVVGLETARARALLRDDKELAPILYIDDPKMADTVASVKEKGVDGINFFVFKKDWAAMTAAAFS